MSKIFLLLTSVNSNVGDRWRKVSHPIVSDCLNLLTRGKKSFKKYNTSTNSYMHT